MIAVDQARCLKKSSLEAVGRTSALTITGVVEAVVELRLLPPWELTERVHKPRTHRGSQFGVS